MLRYFYRFIECLFIVFLYLVLLVTEVIYSVINIITLIILFPCATVLALILVFDYNNHEKFQISKKTWKIAKNKWNL